MLRLASTTATLLSLNQPSLFSYQHLLRPGCQGRTQAQTGSMWSTFGSHSDTEPEAPEHHEDAVTCLVGGH